MTPFIFNMPATQMHNDLKYWSDKLKYAETLPLSTKRENMERVCRMMLDMYLDKYNEIKKFKDLEIKCIEASARCRNSLIK